MKVEIERTGSQGFAAYSLPGSRDHVLVRGTVITERPDQACFVIQDFEKKGKTRRYILAEQIYDNASFSFQIDYKCDQKSTSRNRYLAQAEKTIKAIRSGKFEKVVLSKIVRIERSDEHLFELFERLKTKYVNAFIFLYYIPGEGCWCGASPEVLIDRKGDTFLTMALAGTQLDHGLPVNEVEWGEKEKHEQSVIEDYIEKTFVEGQIAFVKHGPRTVKAGSVLHILSEFYCNNVNDALDLAEKLHPGPAICGLPQGDALDWIVDHEIHSRNHYCGYIGPWNINGESALFINLRSMRIYQDAYILYVGGGLTKNSDANAEWEETEFKAQTLLSVINRTLAT